VFVLVCYESTFICVREALCVDKLCCNVNKTVCMVFNLKDKSKVVCNNFSCFSVDSKPMQFVIEFKYLGHVIACFYLMIRIYSVKCVICI